jgi:hypothetical protein
MKIDSNKVLVNADQPTVSKFLKDARNIEHLLPVDQFSDWKATEEECSFKVQGGVTISLVQDGSEENQKIFMRSGEKSPFPFRLTIHIEPKDQRVEGYISFDGEVNVFLRMMVEKPLTALFNIMSENLQKYFKE